MTQTIHKPNDFTGSTNLAWVARTANRRYRTWQEWKQQADETNDTLAAKIADNFHDSYVEFVTKYQSQAVQ